MSRHYDLVIVGGGLVGASLAVALRPLGLTMALIEAVPFRSGAQPSYDDRMLALAQGSKRILETMGIWAAVQADTTPIHSIHISDRGHFGATRLNHRQFEVEALGYTISARALGNGVLQALPSGDVFDLLCPARVSALTRHDDRIELRAESDSGPVRISASLAVIADGAESATRELAGIPACTRDYGQTAIVSTVTTHRPHRNRAIERFTATGPTALLPVAEDRYAVVWTARRDDAARIASLPETDFLDQLQQRVGERAGHFSRLGARRTYDLRRVIVSRVTDHRVAVIGNAAHTVHPVAGQGFNLGLRDAAVLAEVIAGARRSSGDIGAPDVLDQYAAWRRRDTFAVSGFTDSLIRLFANDLVPAVALRGLAMLAVDNLPFAKRFLVRRTMGLAGRVPRLACGLTL